MMSGPTLFANDLDTEEQSGVLPPLPGSSSLLLQEMRAHIKLKTVHLNLFILDYLTIKRPAIDFGCCKKLKYSLKLFTD